MTKRSPFPRAAIEVATDEVRMLMLGDQAESMAFHRLALPPETIRPGQIQPNILNSGSLGQAIERMIEESGYEEKAISLLIPDIASRVALLDFESLPKGAKERDQLVRFRLKKMLPYPETEARLAVAKIPGHGGARRLLVESVRESILAGYESVLEEMGLVAGLIDTSTFGLMSLLGRMEETRLESTALVNLGDGYVSIAIIQAGHLVLYRTKAAPSDPAEIGSSLVKELRLSMLYYVERLGGEPVEDLYLRCNASLADGLEEALCQMVTGALRRFDASSLLSGLVLEVASDLSSDSLPGEALSLLGLLSSRPGVS